MPEHPEVNGPGIFAFMLDRDSTLSEFTQQAT